MHLFFDFLAYFVAWAVMRLWFQNPQQGREEKDAHYVLVLIIGFVSGAVLFSTLNNLLSTGMFVLGKSIIGALAGAIIAVEIFKRYYHIEGSTGAYFVPSLAIGIAIGRIGCFLTGLEDYTYGTPTNVPWGVDFGDGIIRHPVQLYESAAMFGFFLFSLWLYRRNRRYFETKVFYIFVFFYALQRFVWEFFKPYANVAFGLNIFQLVALILIVYAMTNLKRSAYGTLYTKV